MAKIDIRMPTEFLGKLSRLASKTDAIIEKTLEAGGEVVEDKVRSNLSAVIGKDTKVESRSTGELLDSLGTSPVDVDAKGNYNVHVGFNEPRRQQSAAKGKRNYGVRTNAMIANVLEYGKSGQAPKPFLAPAKAQSKKQCIETMKSTFESEVNGI